VDCGLPRCSLKVSAADAGVYGRFVRLIDAETAPGEAILAIPNDAELYFLARRRNPTPFYNAVHGTTTPEQLGAAIRVLEHTPPRLVIFRPTDKYQNRSTAELMAAVRGQYALAGHQDGTEIYRR
jgi:hypothetical protein